MFSERNMHIVGRLAARKGAGEPFLLCAGVSRAHSPDPGSTCIFMYLWGRPDGKQCDTWAKARGRQITLTMQIHTMQILISQILCVGKIRSRPAPGA